MGLAKKIEEIKRKPEHIRLRYIWLFVFVSMLFVIALWIFSMQSRNASTTENTGQILNLDSLNNQIEQQKNTLQQTTKTIQNSTEAINAGADKADVPGNPKENKAKSNMEKSPENNNINTNSFPGE